MPFTAGSPVYRPLAAPRPLTVHERGLLDALAVTAERPGLTELVAACAVTGECSCGCSSVLVSTGQGLREAGDHVGIRAGSRSPDGHLVDVVLHVLGGRPHELEVFDTECGDGVAVPLGDPELS